MEKVQPTIPFTNADLEREGFDTYDPKTYGIVSIFGHFDTALKVTNQPSKGSDSTLSVNGSL